MWVQTLDLSNHRLTGTLHVSDLSLRSLNMVSGMEAHQAIVAIKGTWCSWLSRPLSIRGGMYKFNSGSVHHPAPLSFCLNPLSCVCVLFCHSSGYLDPSGDASLALA